MYINVGLRIIPPSYQWWVPFVYTIELLCISDRSLNIYNIHAVRGGRSHSPMRIMSFRLRQNDHTRTMVTQETAARPLTTKSY